MCAGEASASEYRDLSVVLCGVGIGMQAIAERTELPEQEVELLLMKSLSLGLVKGIISGVERCQFLLFDIIRWNVNSLLRRSGFKSLECCACT